jgi:hypothetical protein
MARPRWIFDLAGTMLNYLTLGTISIRDASGTVELKNKAGTAYAPAVAVSTKMLGANVVNGVILTAPAGLGGDVTLTLPDSGGTDGYLLKTNGAGVTSWQAPTTNSELMQQKTFSQADDGTPIILIASPVSSTVITRILIAVTGTAAGGSPTISVGTVVDPDAYVDELDVDLLTDGTYELVLAAALGASPTDVVITVVSDSQTFAGTVTAWYGIPG